MFNELKKKTLNEKEDVERILLSDVVHSPDEMELAPNMPKIEKLVQMRFKNDDYNFLRITEMDYFEMIKIYKDERPFFSVRMRLWRIYM